MRLCLKTESEKKAGEYIEFSGVGVVENLPSMNRALGSIPITKKKEKKEGESRERKKRERIQFHYPLSH